LNRKKILSASGLRRFLLPGSRREKDIEEILSALREKVGKLLAQGRTVILE